MGRLDPVGLINGRRIGLRSPAFCRFESERELSAFENFLWGQSSLLLWYKLFSAMFNSTYRSLLSCVPASFIYPLLSSPVNDISDFVSKPLRFSGGIPSQPSASMKLLIVKKIVDVSGLNSSDQFTGPILPLQKYCACQSFFAFKWTL